MTPLGNDLSATWDALVNGRSGIAPIKRFDTKDFATKFAGELKEFQVSEFLDHKSIKRMDPFIQYAMAAGAMALADAGLNLPDDEDPERVGVIYGAGFGGMWTFEQNHGALVAKGPRRISAFFIPKTIINLAPGHLSMKYGAKGPSFAPVSACATGNHAIGEATRIIERGDADVMISGSSEAAISPVGVGGFNAMKALSTRNDDPEAASRPFDRDRDGFVMGEGGGCLILEELEHAKKRGAQIYGEVVGYALNSDAYHMTAPAPNGEGAARCMKLALKSARLNPSDIGYINAHGTSTPAGDLAETLALKSVFGKAAMISSTKSMTGHLLGAAGGVEAVFTLMAMKTGVLPPTINLENPDPECDLDYIPNTAREVRVDAALSNSFGFGGTNAVLVFKRLQD